MKKEQLYIYDLLFNLFIEHGYQKRGTLVAEQEVMLSGIQMHRPDIAYFTKEQVNVTRRSENAIPEFVIEIISEGDLLYKFEEKLAEYFKSTVQVVWHIYPENQVVYVYTSRRDVKICLENDICSAAPVLPDFEISVNELFALPNEI